MSRTKNSKPANPVAEELELAHTESQYENIVEDVSRPVIGTVTNCLKLNIREEPNADARVLCDVPAHAQLMIDDNKSTGEWLSVCTETGIDGFCIKKYVTVCR